MFQRVRYGIIILVNILLVIFYVQQSHGVPAAPNIFQVYQPDGSILNVRQRGDEHLRWIEKEDGYTVIKDEATGFYEYADEDVSGQLKSTGIKAHDPAPVPLKKHKKPAAEGASLYNAPSITGQQGQFAPTAPNGQLAAEPVTAFLMPKTGTVNIPVLMINFSDTQPTYTPADFEALLFGTTPPQATGPGSFKDYYKEVSYGKFIVSSGPSGIGGWYTAKNPLSYYTNDVNRLDELGREAVLLAKAAGFDFTPYGNNPVMVIHQGAGCEDSPNALCSQYVTSGFMIVPELSGATSMPTIGVFAHEFGHALGLPDLYDYDGSSTGIGAWGLMGYGVWNTSIRMGDTPAHLEAWSKSELGWLNPIVVKGDLLNTVIPDVETNPVAYRLNEILEFVNGRERSAGEYFLIEHRAKVGFDIGLPGSGLLIWHVDTDHYSLPPGYLFSVNNDECIPGRTYDCKIRHYRVALVQADNAWQLERNWPQGDASDPYPGTAYNYNFNNTSAPNSSFYGGFLCDISITILNAPQMTVDMHVPAYPASLQPLSYSRDAGYVTDGVEPNIGTASTEFTFMIQYTDPCKDMPPSSIEVCIDSQCYPMTHVSTGMYDPYRDGVQYTYKTSLSPGLHNYYFSVLTGASTVKYPAVGTLTGPDVNDLAITTSSLPNGEFGVAYTATLSATGGPMPYSWNLAAGSLLPPGLTLDSATGIISGVPTHSGIFGFTVDVSSGGYIYSKTFSITIPDTLVPVVMPTIPGGTYISSQQVMLDVNQPSTIYCTLDGTMPTVTSPVCGSIINISSPLTLKYFAVDAAGNASAVQTQVYNVIGGTLSALGTNNNGQLGDGTYVSKTTPIQVSGLTEVVAIAAGNAHTVALRNDGTVWAWGDNAHGKLGDGTYVSKTTPIQVSGLTGVVAIAAGDAHTVALRNDGTVWAWGYNYYGQLGDGAYVSKTTPIQVSGLTGVIAIAAGWGHSVALCNDGRVWAWGFNRYGQLGNGGQTLNMTTPVLSSILASRGGEAVAIAAGRGHTVAILKDGTVYSWGDNSDGLVGDGTYTNDYFPFNGGIAKGLTGVDAIAAGYFHTVTLRNDGTVWTWGYNNYGQLGYPSAWDYTLTPGQVIGLTDVTAIAASANFTLALRNDGTVWGWGDSAGGQLGDYNIFRGPMQVNGLMEINAIAAGTNHTLVIETPLTWTVAINGGASITNSTMVALNFSCNIAGLGCSYMRFSNDNITWSAWEAYASRKVWSLAPDAGTKTVYVWFRDIAGNISNVVSDTIDYSPDVTAPTTTASPAGGTYNSTQSVTLACSDGTGSGCDKIYYTTDGATPTTASTVYSTAISISATKTLKFLAKDLAGNSETVKTAVYTIDTTSPEFTSTSPASNSYINTVTVGYTLSEVVASGKITFARTGGSADSSTHVYSFTSSDITAGSHSINTGLVLVNGAVYAVTFEATDSAGNTGSISSINVTYDTTSASVTITSPAANSVTNNAQVSYTLSEDISAGEIVFTRTGGTADGLSPYKYTLAVSERTSGSHTINTGLVLVNGAVYAVTFEATDSAGNTGSVSSINVTYDTTSASVTITSPAANSVTNNAQVSYTLSEDISAGEIVFTRTGGTADGLSPYKYTLAVSERTSGSHTINTGVILIDSAIYTVGFENVTDKAGNATASVSNTNITYDSTAVAITSTSPASNGIITNSTVGYTLSEAATSGKVTFTRSGGNADSGSPHVYTLNGSDLYLGSHTVNTNLSLVDGAFYTVTFEATDFAGNPATTVSNAMVYYDTNYGIGPSGNADNTGYSINRVDGFDLIKLSIAFGSKPGDANWNPVCDLDKNGKVDGSDLITLGAHFGEVQ